MGLRVARLRAVVLLAVLGLAGCTGADKPAANAELVPPPTNYKRQIAVFLREHLTDRADFHGAQVAPPALKQVGPSQHYVVCMRFNGHGERKDKVAIYLGSSVAQFIDAKPELCGDAVFQPFQDLEDITPPI
jgi:hypothetical protein